MKRIVSTSIMFIFLICSLQAQKPKAIVWNWDTIVCFNVYNDISFLLTQNIDEFGRVISNEIKRKDQEWINIERNFYTYDSSANLIQHIVYKWNIDKWDTLSRFIYTYDFQGRLNTEFSEKKGYYSWENLYRIFYTYNVSGNLISKLREVWQNNNWVNSYRYSTTYNINSNISSNVTENWQNNDWVNAYKSIYLYNSIGKKSSEINQIWQGNWENRYKFTSTYNDFGFKVSETQENWQNNSWKIVERYLLANNENGQLLTKTRQTWQEYWLNQDMSTYVYDANGNSVLGMDQTWFFDWKPGNSFWGLDLFVSGEKKHIDYLIGNYLYKAHFVSLNTMSKDSRQFIIYPNPANDFINIYQTNNKIKEIRVVDIHGKKLISKLNNRFENNYSIAIEMLSKGIYFLQLLTDNGIDTKKFVVNR